MSRQPAHPCPTCHGFARVRTTDGQTACARCGTILPPLPEDFGKRTSLSHMTPLRVGMTARVGGKEFYAVGRIRYAETDEGETSYWDEWVLLNPDGATHYLEYDEGRWTLTEPFTPGEAPGFGEFSIAGEGTNYRIDGRTATVFSEGNAKVQAVEGEIPWAIQVGERVRYIDMQAGEAIYSAEVNKEGELEWFRGRRMDDRAIFNLFDLRDLIAALDKRDAKLRGRKMFGLLCVITAVIALICWGASLSRGKVVAQGSTTLDRIPPQEGMRFGPYTLDAVGRVYRLRVSSNLTQAAAWVQGVVEDNTAGELFGIDGDFWDESGVDSDGSWHESSLESSSDFRLSQKKDIYVRLFAERDPATPGAAGATVSFALEQGVLHPTYFAWFGVLGFLVGVVFLIAGSPSVNRKVWESMATS